MAVSKWDQDQTGHTALWGSVYLKPEYRGKHAAAPLYETRTAWTKANNQFKQAVFFIRDGNTRSTEIQVKQGAQYMYSAPMRWANGQVATANWYKIDLAAA